MNKNEQLRTFLLNNAKRLTEEWYDSLDKNSAIGVYASTDSKVIQTLKEQNYEFHLYVCNVFVEDEKDFLKPLKCGLIRLPKTVNTQEHRFPLLSKNLCVFESNIVIV
ncbi:hypothetical protein MUB15_32480 [Priestia sp. OVS21]|nr:hypothetical protein [Priestia sp. OVS21]